MILAIDGLQPDVGQEVLWVLRDCLSGAVLLARSLLSRRQQDLAGVDRGRWTELREGLEVRRHRRTQRRRFRRDPQAFLQ